MQQDKLSQHLCWKPIRKTVAWNNKIIAHAALTSKMTPRPATSFQAPSTIKITLKIRPGSSSWKSPLNYQWYLGCKNFMGVCDEELCVLLVTLSTWAVILGKNRRLCNYAKGKIKIITETHKKTPRKLSRADLQFEMNTPKRRSLRSGKSPQELISWFISFILAWKLFN